MDKIERIATIIVIKLYAWLKLLFVYPILTPILMIGVTIHVIHGKIKYHWKEQFIDIWNEDMQWDSFRLCIKELYRISFCCWNLESIEKLTDEYSKKC